MVKILGWLINGHKRIYLQHRIILFDITNLLMAC